MELYRSDDPTLLTEVISSNYTMLATCSTVHRIESASDYPLRSRDDVKRAAGLFEEDASRNLASRNLATSSGSPVVVSVEEAVSHLHSKWFPIENREQLISRLIIGFEAAQSAAMRLVAEEQYYETSPAGESDLMSLRQGVVSGSLQPNVWTKVVWGWGFYSSDYQSAGTAFPVLARNYPLFKEYTLAAFDCFTFQTLGYADVWFNSATGGNYTIALCPS